MSSANQGVHTALANELAEVAKVAGERLRAETDADRQAADGAGERLVTAATSAMAAGQSLTDIAEAEAAGKDAVRDSLRADTLRTVERSGRHAREARAEHHQAIARAMRLGLSTREIAGAAGVTHGTVRAIASRLGGEDDGDRPTTSSPDEEW